MKSINKVELHEIFKNLKEDKDSKFNELYEKYNKLVYCIAFSMLKNKENSEDIMQKVFLKIWEMDTNKLPTDNEASWLYTIVKNETLNYLRTKKNLVDLEALYYVSDEDEMLNDVIDKDSYNKIISGLNAEEQEIISLKILSNLSFKEIAQILNKPIGTIQWKYYKSLHTLKILISNLSMFIIAMTSFILGKTVNRNKSTNIVEENQANDNQNPNEDTEDTEHKENTEGSSFGDTSNEESKGNVQDKEENEEKNENDNKENETIENIVVENTSNLDYKDIGILSIAGITLTVTIIFLIIFMKHQQKMHRKVSK